MCSFWGGLTWDGEEFSSNPEQEKKNNNSKSQFYILTRISLDLPIFDTTVAGLWCKGIRNGAAASVDFFCIFPSKVGGSSLVAAARSRPLAGDWLDNSIKKKVWLHSAGFLGYAWANREEKEGRLHTECRFSGCFTWRSTLVWTCPQNNPLQPAAEIFFFSLGKSPQVKHPPPTSVP